MNWWQYLLLANVYLLLFYGFYALLLRSETFFRLNRLYLVASAGLSFLIPVIQADWLRNLFITQRINQTIYQLDVVNITAYQAPVNHSLTIGQLVAALYLAVAAGLLIKFAVSLIRLRQAFKIDADKNAFSFFGKIKMHKGLPEADVIAAHEHVHARQWHSADVLLIELVTIINWFNPVVYLYRKAIKHIHEFIADSEIISHGTEKQTYAMLLLSQAVNVPVNQLANSFFNHSLLKQRIMMLHKNPSHRAALLKYGLSAPLFALMLILSSATAKTTNAISVIQQKAAQVMQASPAVTIKTIAAAVSAPVSSTAQEPAIQNAGAQGTAQQGVQAAQPPIEADTVNKKGPVFTSVQESAAPAGGFDSFYQFLGRNIRYPADARSKGVQGRVICQFVVEQDGTLSDIKVVRGVAPSIDQEAVRVLTIAEPWTPGKQNGKVVRQQYTIPISFAIVGGGTTTPAGNRKEPPPPPAPANGKLNDVAIVTYADTAKRALEARRLPKDVEVYINNKLVPPDSLNHVNPQNIQTINVIGPTAAKPETKKQIRIITKN